MTNQDCTSDNQNAMNTEVLVMMDLQPNLLKVIPDSESFIQSCEIAIKAFKYFDLSILLTEQVPNKMGSTVEDVDKLITTSDSIISKHSFSAFGSDLFLNKLKELSCKNLILGGIETSICIYLTAIDALSYGFNVTILSDCVACRRFNDGQSVLHNLQAKGVSVLPLESFLFSKLRSSEHPQFKEISAMIRHRATESR